jgi:hypothetical protein
MASLLVQHNYDASQDLHHLHNIIRNSQGVVSDDTISYDYRLYITYSLFCVFRDSTISILFFILLLFILLNSLQLVSHKAFIYNSI